MQRDSHRPPRMPYRLLLARRTSGAFTIGATGFKPESSWLLALWKAFSHVSPKKNMLKANAPPLRTLFNRSWFSFIQMNATSQHICLAAVVTSRTNCPSAPTHLGGKQASGLAHSLHLGSLFCRFWGLSKSENGLCPVNPPLRGLL